jgi:hypothetical protein
LNNRKTIKNYNRRRKNIENDKKYKKIYWGGYDSKDKPQISFDPKEEDREKLIELLTANIKKLEPERRSLRTQLEKKLASEFIRSYSRFISNKLKKNEKKRIRKRVTKQDVKFAKDASVYCIIKGITPYRVFLYWYDNMNIFVNRDMVLPPLSFFSQETNIDEVNIHLFETKYGLKPENKIKHNILEINKYNKLYPNLRRTLMSSGFNLSEISDDHLINIQLYAINYAVGTIELCKIPNNIRKIATHISEILKNHFSIDRIENNT